MCCSFIHKLGLIVKKTIHYFCSSSLASRSAPRAPGHAVFCRRIRGWRRHGVGLPCLRTGSTRRLERRRDRVWMAPSHSIADITKRCLRHPRHCGTADPAGAFSVVVDLRLGRVSILVRMAPSDGKMETDWTNETRSVPPGGSADAPRHGRGDALRRRHGARVLDVPAEETQS